MAAPTARVARELTTIAVIAAYVLAVGWQPSVARAAVAGALASLAWLRLAPRDRWHFLAVGALVLLAWMPTPLLDPDSSSRSRRSPRSSSPSRAVRRRSDALPLRSPWPMPFAVALAVRAGDSADRPLPLRTVPLYTVVA
jgi:hypothetical protein